MNEAKVRLALGKRTIRYSREHDDSKPFPYEVAFTIPEWEALEAALTLAAEPKRSEHKLATMWRKDLDARSKIAPKSDYERGRDAQFKVCIEELEATEQGRCWHEDADGFCGALEDSAVHTDSTHPDLHRFQPRHPRTKGNEP